MLGRCDTAELPAAADTTSELKLWRARRIIAGGFEGPTGDNQQLGCFSVN